MKSRFFEKFDYLLLICILVLISLGIAFIYSSGVNSEGILVTNEYIKQIIEALHQCTDIELLEIIKQLLQKSR